MCNGLDLFLRIEIFACDPIHQFRALCGIGQTQGVNQQEGLLVAEDVASDVLAKGARVAIHIQQIFLLLESQAYVNTERIQFFCVGSGCASQQCAHLQGTSQEHGGLQADHLHVLLFGHIQA